MSIADEYIARDQRRAWWISALVFLLYFLLALKTEFLLSFAVITGLALALGLVYLMLKHPGYGVAVMIIGTSLDQLGKIPGTPITVFHLGFLISLGAWLVHLLRSEEITFHSTNFNLPLVLFMAMISFSLIYTPDRADATVNFLRLLALVAVMYITINVVSDQRTLQIILASLILSAFVLSIFALTSIGGTSTSLMQVAMTFSKVFGRFGVTFENPNYFATFLMLALAVSASFIINGGISLLLRIVLIAIFGVIFIGMIGTFSRAAWVALVPAAVFVIYHSKYRRVIFIGGIFVAIFSIFILWNSLFFQSFVMRFASLSNATADPSSMTRVFLFRGGWNMLLDSYFLGVGYRGFPVLYQQLYIPHSQVLFDVFESHTLPMEILAELGIIGFGLFAWLIKRYFQHAFFAIRPVSSPFLRASFIGVVAAMIGYFTNSLFSPGQLSGNFLWIGFGLTYAIPRLAEPAASRE
jgi:O-antigen ligase